MCSFCFLSIAISWHSLFSVGGIIHHIPADPLGVVRERFICGQITDSLFKNINATFNGNNIPPRSRQVLSPEEPWSGIMSVKGIKWILVIDKSLVLNYIIDDAALPLKCRDRVESHTGSCIVVEVRKRLTISLGRMNTRSFQRYV